MSKKRKPLVLGEIFKDVATEIGATVELEPSWKMSGQITFKNGRRSYFRYNALDINAYGASLNAKDKDFANYFMEKMGYPIIPGSKTVFSKEWGEIIGEPENNVESGYLYAKELGFPVIVKPNSGSQGSDVELVYNKKEFFLAMHRIFKNDRIALIQSYVSGPDYRVVILDNKIISAYKRIPLNVVGDGKSTVKQLLTKKQQEFLSSGRNAQINIEDPRIKNKLKHQKLSFDSVPESDHLVYLLDNANLSSGGDAIDVTKSIHPKFKKSLVGLAKDMNLRFCGIDLIITKGCISDKPTNYYVLEINASPGLDHYIKLGEEQSILVKKLYKKVLKHMSKSK